MKIGNANTKLLRMQELFFLPAHMSVRFLFIHVPYGVDMEAAPPGRRGCLDQVVFWCLWAADQMMLMSSSELLTHLMVMVWGTMDAEMGALM